MPRELLTKIQIPPMGFKVQETKPGQAVQAHRGVETEEESWRGMLLSVLRQRSPQVEGWALEEGKVPRSAKGPPPPYCSRFFWRILSCELSSLPWTVHIKLPFLFCWRWGGSGDSCQ